LPEWRKPYCPPEGKTCLQRVERKKKTLLMALPRKIFRRGGDRTYTLQARPLTKQGVKAKGGDRQTDGGKSFTRIKKKKEKKSNTGMKKGTSYKISKSVPKRNKLLTYRTGEKEGECRGAMQTEKNGSREKNEQKDRHETEREKKLELKPKQLIKEMRFCSSGQQNGRHQGGARAWGRRGKGAVGSQKKENKCSAR